MSLSILFWTENCHTSKQVSIWVKICYQIFQAVVDILNSHFELLEQPTSFRLYLVVSLTLSRKIMAFIWNKHAHLLADSEPKPISCWLPPLWVPGSLPVLNFHSLNNNMRTETIKTSICITFCTECFGFKQEIPHLTHNLLKAVTISCHGKYVESELKQVFRNQSFTAQYLHLSFQSV